MPRDWNHVLDIPTADPDGIATTQTVPGAQSLTLDGTLVNADGIAELGDDDTLLRIQIVAATNTNSVMATITGTNEFGAQTEVLAVPGSTSPVVSTLYWRTVGDIAISGAMVGNVTAGTASDGATPWSLPNTNVESFQIGLSVTRRFGTGLFTVQHTFDFPPRVATPAVFNNDAAALVDATAVEDGNFAYPVTAFRLRSVTADSSANGWTFIARQSGRGGAYGA